MNTQERAATCSKPDVVVGKRCTIQNNVSVYKGVTLQDGVFRVEEKDGGVQEI